MPRILKAITKYPYFTLIKKVEGETGHYAVTVNIKTIYGWL